MVFLHIFTLIDGKLKILPNGLLPIARKQGSNKCRARGGCSLAGDDRADENIALLSMHTLWVREHNRIVKELKSLNPNWNNEKLFQTTRKIVGAMLQHITYNEYLPFLINLPEYKGYNPNVDPSIINGFANAAFRYGHSLVPNSFEQLDMGFNRKHKPMALQDAFLNRAFISANGIEPTMFGLVKNVSRTVDEGFAFGIARKLFVGIGSNDYLDLTALNIQRGRDHGLRGYNIYRKICGLGVSKTWKGIKNTMVPGAGDRFQKVYTKPDDIDLFAGGISEIQASGSIVGPLFQCILSRQFKNLRDGDRFYYENKDVFSPSQLKEIKRVKLSKVLCNNLKDIVSIQPDAFLADTKGNSRKSCDSIQNFKLDAWREN